ncbi:hypothetical protein Tco_1413794, partial [Tanacetum coccineum]
MGTVSFNKVQYVLGSLTTFQLKKRKAKDIWENVKMIPEGSELTKDDRESQLYDEFEHFCQIKGETIHVYYVRLTKLINDMRNINMTMPRMHLNSKFVNNMLLEWSRFITEVKLNRGLKESNFDQLYAYLKQHEVHANENRMMMERFIHPTNDPLALVSNASNQKYPTQLSDSPQSSNQPSLNTMAEQNVSAQAPTRTDKQIVPRSQRLQIRKINLLFDAQKIQKNPIFQISVDIVLIFLVDPAHPFELPPTGDDFLLVSIPSGRTFIVPAG